MPCFADCYSFHGAVAPVLTYCLGVRSLWIVRPISALLCFCVTGITRLRSVLGVARYGTEPAEDSRLDCFCSLYSCLSKKEKAKAKIVRQANAFRSPEAICLGTTYIRSSHWLITCYPATYYSVSILITAAWCPLLQSWSLLPDGDWIEPVLV